MSDIAIRGGERERGRQGEGERRWWWTLLLTRRCIDRFEEEVCRAVEWCREHRKQRGVREGECETDCWVSHETPFVFGLSSPAQTALHRFEWARKEVSLKSGRVGVREPWRQL